MVERFCGEFDFLSNFYECPVAVDGITYKNSEAAYQAMKTLNEEERLSFAELSADLTI